MKKILIRVALIGGGFAVCAGIGAFCRFEYGAPDKTCVLCHEIRASRERMAASPHKDVNCKACHGGTLEALGDNLRRAVRHLQGADYAKLDSRFCLSEKQVDEVSARCAKCHAAEAAQWSAGGHGRPVANYLTNTVHNAAWKPAESCLRCHGMFMAGDLEDILVREGKVCRFRDTSRETRRAVPCLACHRMHAKDSLQLHSRAEKTSFPAQHLYLQKIVAPDGSTVKRAMDARTRLCASCHAANAEGEAGSGDDRTPLGAQEGMACMDCHKGHDLKADNSRGRCPTPKCTR